MNRLSGTGSNRRVPEQFPSSTGAAGRSLLVGVALTLSLLLVGILVVRSDPGPSTSERGRARIQPVQAQADSTRVRAGVYVGTDPRAAAEFGAWLGVRPELVVDFKPQDTWDELANPGKELDYWKGQPYQLVYGVKLVPNGLQEDRTKKKVRAALRAGARGENDRYYEALGRRLVARGFPDAILRIAWEFNLGPRHGGDNDPQVFRAYWRRVVAAFRAVPGSRFTFDWNVNVGKHAYDAPRYYPGGDVVDYVGVDAYDVSYQEGSYPYPRRCDDVCRQQRQEVAWQYLYGGPRGLAFWAGFARKVGKPMSFPEWGLWSRPDNAQGGDDNPLYIRRMREFMEDPVNNVAYECYFNFASKVDGEHRFSAYPHAAEEYRQLFGDPLSATQATPPAPGDLPEGFMPPRE